MLKLEVKLNVQEKNKLQRDWVVGLENPDMAYNDIIGTISLNNSAMATSGNYRNFIDKNGEILGHTVDPRIGKPILSNVLSSTVISSSCMKGRCLGNCFDGYEF